MNYTGTITDPWHVPQGPTPDLRAHVRAVLMRLVDPLAAALGVLLRDPSARTLFESEQACRRLLVFATGHLVAGLLAWLHSDRAFRTRCVAAARGHDSRRLRHQGVRSTSVRFLGGARVRLETPYLTTVRANTAGNEGAAGEGCHPVLECLGVCAQASPALAGEVARQSVRCSGFEEAAEALSEGGVVIDAKSVRHLTLAVGAEALRQRDLRLAAALEGCLYSEEFAGKRIVVSADGGRLRTREPAPPSEDGKPRYETPWVEPKLVIAYVIDDKGRKERSERPLYDGTLGDADAVFDLLIAELLLRGAAKAREIIVTGDGAPWIWNRVAHLAAALEIPPGRIRRVTDFYHAVEHLKAIADLRPGWSDTRRREWTARTARRLKHGEIDHVIEDLRALRTGRNRRKIATEVAYFEERRELMRYDRFRQAGIPLGSGAMESAVRRVVNLRLKGAGIFWTTTSAEAVMHLRSYLKAGRWDELMRRVVERSPDGSRRSELRRAA